MLKYNSLKKFLLLIAFSLPLVGNACHCTHREFMEKYVQSDFVARVVITKNFPNQGSALFYQSNIKIKQLFKGKPVESILVEGSSDGKRRTSCDIFFSEGTEILVYASLDSTGKYSFHSCSGYRVLSQAGSAGQVRELEMLDFLDKNNIKPIDKTHYGVDLHDKLKDLRNIDATKSFAIYEVTFARNLHVDSVRTLTGFTPQIDNDIASILKGARWVSNRVLIDGLKNEVPDGSKLLVGFYFYPAESRWANFISQWDL